MTNSFALQAQRLGRSEDELLAIVTEMVTRRTQGYDYFLKKIEEVETTPTQKPTLPDVPEGMPEALVQEIINEGYKTVADWKEANRTAQAEAQAKEVERQRRRKLEEEELARIEAEGYTPPTTVTSLFGSDEEEVVEEEATLFQSEWTEEDQRKLDEEKATFEAEMQRKADEAKARSSWMFMTDEEFDAQSKAKVEDKKLQEAIEALGTDPLEAMNSFLILETGSPKKRAIQTWLKAFGSDINNLQLGLTFLYENHAKQSGAITALLETYTENFTDHTDYRVIEKPVKERTPEQEMYAERAREARLVNETFSVLTSAERPKAVADTTGEIIDMTKPMFDLTEEKPVEKPVDALTMTHEELLKQPLFSDNVVNLPEALEKAEPKKEVELFEYAPIQW